MTISLELLQQDLNTAIANRNYYSNAAIESEGMIKLLRAQIEKVLSNMPPVAPENVTHDHLVPTIEESNSEINEVLPEVSNG